MFRVLPEPVIRWLSPSEVAALYATDYCRIVAASVGFRGSQEGGCHAHGAQDIGLTAWLRLCADQGWAELETAVRSAASRIAREPALQLAAETLVPLSDEALRAVTGGK